MTDLANAPVEIEISGERIIGDWRGADPFQPNFRDDPYPALNRLRETDPVNLTPVGTWRICRFDDIESVFRKAKTFRKMCTHNVAIQHARAPAVFKQQSCQDFSDR